MIHQIIATVFFVGRLPASGTLGTLVGIPVVYLISFNQWTLFLGFLIVSVAGLVATEFFLQETTEEDPEEVVIDELAGYIACFLLVEPSLKTYLTAFLLFRVFDIFKPFPINLFERLPRSFGVMADDIVAGLLVSFILFLLLNR